MVQLWVTMKVLDSQSGDRDSSSRRLTLRETERNKGWKDIAYFYFLPLLQGRACLPAVSEELERQGVEAAGAPGIWEGPSPRHEPSHSEAVRLPCFILMLTFGRTRPVVGTMPRFSGSHVGMRVARHSCYPDERYLSSEPIIVSLID